MKEIKDIRDEIFKLADEKYKNFHSSLCPGTNNIIGVRIPKLRNYAKQLLNKYKLEDILANLKQDYYEEIMLEGMLIGLSNIETEKRIQYIENFVPKIDNWAICDIFCAGLKFTKKNKKIVWQMINRYLNSTKEFELRFAIVMMLDFYITEDYIDVVIPKLCQISHEGYYVKMAVAWAISICFIKFPKKTYPILTDMKLEKFTHNKSIQKIIESYRVDENVKNELRKLKI